MLKRISKLVVALTICVSMVLGVSIYTKADVTHKVTFLYGTKAYSVDVPDGCSALPPTDTYVPGYNFMGWVGSFINVKSDITVLGAYDKVATPAPTPTPAPAQQKTYEVRFVDSLTGAQYYHQTVSEGAYANPPEVPYHPGYHFEGYDGSFTNVNSDRTIYVKYGWDYYYDNPGEGWWWYEDTDEDGYEHWWWMS